MQGKFKILTDSQFNKIFAKALLKGAIANIFEYIKFLQNHDNDVNPQGQLLKVLQFQRDLLLGGLQSRHDVNGIDAAKLALELKQLQDRYPKDFRSKYVDKVDFGGIMNYIEKEQKNLQSLKLTAKQNNPLKFQGVDQKAMDSKPKFDLEAYEQQFVNHALEKRRSKKQGSINIDTKNLNADKLTTAEKQAQQKIDFLEREEALFKGDGRGFEIRIE